MTSRTRACLPILAALFHISAVMVARSEPYVVEGLTLGGKIPVATPNYRSYTCKPSEHFEGYTWCQRTQRRSTSAGSGSLASAFIHAEDGTAIYLMSKIAPLSISRAVVQKEIEDLSRRLKARPAKIEWVPGRPGVPPSVIALWGQVELRKLKPYEAEIADGADPTLGLLVDSLGDTALSAKSGLPIYRIAGGAGYLYSASFDVGGRGHRRDIAADVSHPAIRKFEPALREVLTNDRSLASNDYKLWPQVSELTRNLSLATSPMIANKALDGIFDDYPSKKLRSHAWSLLPLGSLLFLPEQAHSSIGVYGPKTAHPEIREDIQEFLAKNPSEPFSEFLYYTIGEFEKALQVNPNSIIKGVLRYAIAHRIIESLLQESATVVKLGKLPDTGGPVNDTLAALNAHPERYDHKPLGSVVPNFAVHAAAARPWLEQVLGDASSPHQDDAAYMLGWLAFHESKFKEALGYLSQAMTAGNGDYRKPAAMRQVVRIMARLPAREQITMVESSAVFAQQPALWYMAARSAYRDFNYALAIETAERGLRTLKVPLDRLPATTDPQKIKEALEKVEPKPDDDLNLDELPYLIEASREIQQYEAYLKSAATDRPDNLDRRARAIISKYSMLLDPPEQTAGRRSSPELAHKDLRQAIRLADVTLERAPKSARHAALREWLHYRKARMLVQFAPGSVVQAVAALEQEFPKSQLMDDALAEQLYAQGIMLRDVNAAERTFQKLLASYPKGNAVDNAYTWMAIVYRCTGRTDAAQRINREIVRLFPTTRHAHYARDRLAKPDATACGLSSASQD